MQDHNNKQLKLSTQSLALAAAIQLASDSKLQSIEKVDDKKVCFIFDHPSGLDEIVNLFWQKQLAVDALSYFESLRYLKSLLHESLNSSATKRGKETYGK